MGIPWHNAHSSSLCRRGRDFITIIFLLLEKKRNISKASGFVISVNTQKVSYLMFNNECSNNIFQTSRIDLCVIELYFVVTCRGALLLVSKYHGSNIIESHYVKRGPPHKVRKSNIASWFSCQIILGCNFQKFLAAVHNIWSDYKESAEIHLVSQYYGVWIWDEKHFSDQAAKEYMWFWDMKISLQSGSLLHGLKGSSSNTLEVRRQYQWLQQWWCK